MVKRLPKKSETPIYSGSLLSIKDSIAVLCPEVEEDPQPNECMLPMIFLCSDLDGNMDSVGFYTAVDGGPELNPIVFRVPYEKGNIDSVVSWLGKLMSEKFYKGKNVTVMASDNFMNPNSECSCGHCEKEFHDDSGEVVDIEEVKVPDGNVVVSICNSGIMIPYSDGRPVYPYYVVVSEEFKEPEGRLKWIGHKQMERIFKGLDKSHVLSMLASVLLGDAMQLEYGGDFNFVS
jgi:hypothetical protein